MCVRCDPGGGEPCFEHGHLLAFGDGGPDDECARCGLPGPEVLAEMERREAAWEAVRAELDRTAGPLF